MNDQELIDKLHLAFSLIAKLATAMDMLAKRVIEAEARIARFEADAIIERARG